MDNINKILKEDINFLEFPTWVLSSKATITTWTIEKHKGKYEITSPKGLPTHFDRLVLYYVLSKLYNEKRLMSLELTTTRYEIAKNIYSYKKVTGKEKFDRILKSLKKWESTSISFEGIFYENDAHTVRFFHILDDVILNKETKELYIKFNQQYIQQLRETKFYKYIDFNQYKLLIRPVSARLYEILIKTFKGRSKWDIGIQKLAEKLTLEKRSNAKAYYPSDVIAKIIPAIAEINDKTDLCIKFEYDKQADLFFFTDTTEEYKKLHNVEQDQPIEPARVVFNESNLVHVLIAWDISQEKAQELIQTYSEPKIRHMLALLQTQKDAIKKPAGWLIKALEQNWDTQAYEKRLQEEQRRQEAQRKWQEQEAQRKLLENLKQQHAQYIETKAHEVYKLLPAKIAKIYDQQYITWLQERKQYPFGKYVPDAVHRLDFLKEMVLDEADVDFKLWAQAQGHAI